MRKRGKHFKGKGGLHPRFDPVALSQPFHTIGWQHGLDADQRDTLERAVLVAYEALRTGKANADQVAKLVGAVEISGELCKTGLGAEYADIIEQARVALERIKRRAATLGGRYVIDGPAAEPLQTAIALHVEHLRHSAKREVGEAVERLKARQAEKKTEKLARLEGEQPREATA